jgi:hypothetical protein
MTLQLDVQRATTVHTAQGLTIAEARDLLDWLESRGIDNAELDLDESEMIAVRWTE